MEPALEHGRGEIDDPSISLPPEAPGVAEDVHRCRLQPHQLFNRINNDPSTFILDTRTLDRFAACCIRGSHHLPQPSALADLMVQLIKPTVRGQRHFVLLQPSDMSASDKLVWIQAFEDAIKARREPISCPAVPAADGSSTPQPPNEPLFVAKLYLVPNCELFFESYASCSALFNLGPNPSSGSSQQYYASEILPGFLYLGDYANATDRNQLEQLGITHIIDATAQTLSQAAAQDLGIAYLPIDIWDVEEADISVHFPATNLFMNTAHQSNESSRPQRVLVHCRAGVSRSASIVLAFVMQHLQIDLLAAANLVYAQRKVIFPNPSFCKQLMAYERELFPDRAPSCDDLTLLKVFQPFATTVEADFDRIPVRAFKNRNAAFTMADMLPPPEGTAPAASMKPKQPFLKRGSKKQPVKKPVKPAEQPAVDAVADDGRTEEIEAVEAAATAVAAATTEDSTAAVVSMPSNCEV